MICPECKKEVPSDSGYCSYCGAQLTKHPSIHPLHPIKSRNQQGVPMMTFCANGISFNMIKVEGGSFYRGITLEEVQRTTRQRTGGHGFPLITVDTFFIAETTVTQELWEAVVHEQDHLIDYWDSNKGTNNPSFIRGRELPVYVPFYAHLDAGFFICKLNSMIGWTFSLPTGDQWEFAARGGNLNKGCLYSGSNNINEVAWYVGNSKQFVPNKSNIFDVFHQDYVPHRVRMKRPNELGIYDMSGNVAEMCLGGGRRGGSYRDSDYFCQVNNSGGEFKGFRLVLNKCDNMR